MEETEEALPGGVRHGQTVRVGDTIRKPSGAWTPTVHALLRHLTAKGFPAPKPLGIDGQGREILSFIAGEPTTWPFPSFFQEPEAVAHLGRMLRRYHEVVADFVPPADAIWQECDQARPGRGEVVCHCDFAPYNLIWRDKEIVGVIDWEWARPAPPIRDIAFTAWMTVPLRHGEDREDMGSDQLPYLRERLTALLSGYGTADRYEVLERVLALQLEFRDRIALGTREPWITFRKIGLDERNVRDHAWLRANYEDLLH